MSCHAGKLPAGDAVLVCKTCETKLAIGESVMPACFAGLHGPALLVRQVDSVRAGEAEEREMRTGKHVARDVYCVGCDTIVGWKYDLAYENDQKYNEGKYVLERELISENRPEYKDEQAVVDAT